MLQIARFASDAFKDDWTERKSTRNKTVAPNTINNLVLGIQIVQRNKGVSPLGNSQKYFGSCWYLHSTCDRTWGHVICILKERAAQTLSISEY